MSTNDYPTEKELEKIAKWDIRKNSVIELLEYIRRIWWMEDLLFNLTGKRVLKLRLHTGGWSGNEDIIYALKQNLFWSMYWQKSLRGGHYYFKITLNN